MPPLPEAGAKQKQKQNRLGPWRRAPAPQPPRPQRDLAQKISRLARPLAGAALAGAQRQRRLGQQQAAWSLLGEVSARQRHSDPNLR